MLIPYPYNPATQDLWIYEDHQISWTVPEPSTSVVKRPIAWNPSSPLYGYRRSLRGISARFRTFSTFCSDPVAAVYAEYNNPALEANKPVYYNSYPMQFLVMSEKFMWACGHCFNMLGARNPNYRFVGTGGYTPGTFFESSMQFRWFDHDNSVIASVSPTNVMLGYSSDPPTNLDCNLSQCDLAILEFIGTVSVPPMQAVDARNMGVGQTLWILDSNHKIGRLRMVSAAVKSGRDQYRSQLLKPDGTEVPKNGQLFLHDSGSLLLAEISPPSSPEAGDGVLGVVPVHAYFATNFVDSWYGSQRVGYGDFQAPGNIAGTLLPTNVFSYCAGRGSPLLPMRSARRTTALALQSVDAQILATMEGLLA